MGSRALSYYRGLTLSQAFQLMVEQLSSAPIGYNNCDRVISPWYTQTHKHNLKMYQGYLNQCIRTAKKEYYVNEFTKYKNDIRKTWDTLKSIICKNKMKSEYPRNFIDRGQQIAGDKNIADKFNEYFTQIGPSLANSIDISNKATFDTYLKKPISIRIYRCALCAENHQKLETKI